VVLIVVRPPATVNYGGRPPECLAPAGIIRLRRSAVSGLGLRFGERVGTQCCEQSFGGWVWPVPPGEGGTDVAGGLRGDREIAHVGAAGEGEAGDEGDADPGADERAHEAVVAGAAGDAGMEAADGGEHVQDAADLAPPVDPAFAGELGQADRWPP